MLYSKSTNQADAIRRHTDLSVGAYIGADGVDYWARERWYEEFEKHHVFVMTAQILLDVLLHHFFELSSSNLLIFDECHSVVKDHPMRSVERGGGYRNLVKNSTALLILSNAQMLLFRTEQSDD